MRQLFLLLLVPALLVVNASALFAKEAEDLVTTGHEFDGWSGTLDVTSAGVSKGVYQVSFVDGNIILAQRGRPLIPKTAITVVTDKPLAYSRKFTINATGEERGKKYLVNLSVMLSGSKLESTKKPSSLSGTMSIDTTSFGLTGEFSAGP